MAHTGSGRANLSMRPMVLPSGRALASSSATSAISGSIQASARGVSAFCTKRR